MKIVVGLGNPGPRYKSTRHNVGFEAVQELASRCLVVRQESRFDALIGHANMGQEKVLLVKPMTFMNRSGNAVQPLVDWYKVDLKDLMVIYDDMDLPVGTLRIRPGGGSGGHKGMQSIIQRLGSKEFPRTRIGIGRSEHEAIDWVLGRFTSAEKEAIDQAVKKAVDALECWIKNGIDLAMNSYNKA
ncbi:MAG: aminoacyl-tRNA hydrolase [Syntrophomonadaceae bacterium]|jgi:PTH1 family peptidyl-tRNA hydrolase